MPPWLHEWIAQLAIVCATIGARIRRIGPRARTVMRESKARNFPNPTAFSCRCFSSSAE